MNNIFEGIPESIEQELSETLITSDDVKIERIVSRGHKSPPSGWYDQHRNEWVIVLQGKAIVSFENDTRVQMQAGDFINIPAHKKHKVEWTHPDIDTIWLAVHY